MSKYIPADKLITALEKRMEETKSMKPAFDQFWAGQISAFKGAVDIAKSLQQEQSKLPGYDEAYLNECIAKARQTWKGVDVDKYMDEMRRREQEQPDAKLDGSIVNEWASRFSPEILDGIKSTAYHFWNMANGVKDSKLEL